MTAEWAELDRALIPSPETTVRPSSILIALTLLCTLDSSASAAPADGGCRVFVDDGERARSRASSPVRPRWGERVPYRSFDGAALVLTAYPGVHVEVLLSDSWTAGPQALADDEIRRLVSRGDLLYETYRALTGVEPQGEGPLQIAAVPIDGVAGYGYKGMKGVEISEALLAETRTLLASDASTPLLSHEMAHNFDRSSQWLAVGDGLHAWTSLVQELALIYEQGVTEHPAEALASAIRRLEYPDAWLADPRFSFDACVSPDSSCGTPRMNAMFAYLGLRMLQLHGLERAPRLLQAIARWDERWGETYEPRSAADAYIEALSETFERDASCLAERWKWHASPALRQRLAARFGPNPDCADGDADGWTPVEGDPDDADPGSHPEAAEVPDGRDNDADGVIDNAYFADGIHAGFGANLPVTVPVTLDGTIDRIEAADYFVFSLATAERLLMNGTRRGGFEGAVRLFRLNESGEVAVENTAFAEYGRTSRAWDLPAGSYRLMVSGSVPGGYRVSLHPAREWPAAWGTVAHRMADGRAHVVVDTSMAALPEQPTAVVFWVEGLGEVARLPWQPRVELDWSVPAEMERIRVRARLLDGDRPLTGWSLPSESRSGARRRAVSR